MSFETLRYEVDADGIALVTFDVPGKSMNTLTNKTQDELNSVIDQAVGDAAVKGIVITSGKPGNFFAGADLVEVSGHFFSDAMANAAPKQVAEQVAVMSNLYRKLETCGKPVAVAVDGLAVGGGFELVMACHYRVASDNPKTQFGLPEVKVGLLPGAGGTQRLPRIIGVQPALLYILEGKNMSAMEAKGLGVVQEVAPAAEIVAKAKAWVLANPTKGSAPWDAKDFKVPGGAGHMNPKYAETFIGGSAMVSGRTFMNYEAPRAIMATIYEGVQLPIDRALALEIKYFTKLILGTQAKAMIRTLFVNKQAAEKGARRPADIAPMPCKKIAMLGAGLMGAGIAMVTAQAGIEVVLLDRDQASAEKGKAYTADRLAKDVKRGKMSQDKADAILARIHPTERMEDVAGADLVIEAVFEERGIKAEITKRTEAVLGPDVIFGSNTSTLPITGLAEAWSKQENFIGIHFFSPVEKMPLVEIIVGKNTGPTAIAKAIDYVAQIRKTPIVVNDSRGFYTSRCFGTYVLEGYHMIAEGAGAALVDNCGRFTGMPVGPLAVGDEVAIDLSYKIKEQSKKDLGDAYVHTKGDDVIDKMMELGRFGRKNGKGFFVYPEDGGKKYLWPDLPTVFPLADEQPSPDDVKTRLIFRQIVECARCFAEGVLETPEDGDLGAIFGWGFLPFTGGPFSYMDSLGLAKVVEILDGLAAKHGPRFAPPQLLRDMAAKGASFYGHDSLKQAA
ncbi:MAG: 3-hydroxyacyl-CoA dehydrogenase [Sphingomonadales bacterium]|nr:MAG: 3-hydroxyacyl-CoA dehydrogenase [Sphingomonadales bacterium]